MPDRSQLLELTGKFGHGVHHRVSPVLRVRETGSRAGAEEVSGCRAGSAPLGRRCSRTRCSIQWELLEAAGENRLDGAVGGTAVGERPLAGGLEAGGTVGVGEAQDALGAAQPFDDAVTESTSSMIAWQAGPIRCARSRHQWRSRRKNARESGGR